MKSLTANGMCVAVAAVAGGIAALIIQLVINHFGLDFTQSQYSLLAPAAAGAGYAGCLAIFGTFLCRPVVNPVMCSRLMFAVGLAVVVFGLIDDCGDKVCGRSEITFVVTTLLLSAVAAISMHKSGVIAQRRFEKNTQAG